ncbi:uncharacterized protein LOC127872048 [Dreissena polymorpha]|uniref:uncharacterized protein LOC127872048 n=1 Tax=Dreissena polymorpha TaxID=45954 RepID=UPI002264F51A|nr:uncharacterized protein LOC127872048 [Dreissena polymorpha]
MLRINLNRLNRITKAEELLAEERAGFRAERSTVEQIFNRGVIIEKHLQYQRELFHIFIDFKKGFDRVWHDGLWQVLRGFNNDEGLVKVIQELYGNASSAVSTEKSKIMVNSTNNYSADFTVNGEKLEEATTFKYLTLLRYEYESQWQLKRWLD